MSGPPKIHKVVSLNSEHALEELKSNNSGRHVIVQSIIASGAAICRPGLSKASLVRVQADDPSCAAHIAV